MPLRLRVDVKHHRRDVLALIPIVRESG